MANPPCARCGSLPVVDPDADRVGAGGLRSMLCAPCILLGPLTPDEAARYRARLAEDDPDPEDDD